MECEYLDVDGRQEPRPQADMRPGVCEADCVFCQLIRGTFILNKILNTKFGLV